MPEHETYQNFITELRRGSLTMMVLGCLKKSHYGYALLQTLQMLDVDIQANTLYPLLRRLETQGLLTSDWDTSESRPRKYYHMSGKGEEVLAGLMTEWKRLTRSMEIIYGGEQSI